MAEELELSGPNRTRPYAVRAQIADMALDILRRNPPAPGQSGEGYLHDARARVARRLEDWSQEAKCTPEEKAYLLSNADAAYADASSQYRQLSQSGDAMGWHNAKPRDHSKFPPSSPNCQTPEERAYHAGVAAKKEAAKAEEEAAEQARQEAKDRAAWPRLPDPRIATLETEVRQLRAEVLRRGTDD